MRKILQIILSGLFIMAHSAFAQYSSENGYSLPFTGTIRVLVVYAEMDCASCSDGTGICTKNCDKNGNNCVYYEPNTTKWPAHQIPVDADKTFDHYLAPGQLPTGFITKYYYDMSAGNHIVLGDYYPNIVTVSCKEATDYNSATNEVFEKLNLVAGTFKTTHTNPVTGNKYTLDDFDNWTNTNEYSDRGVLKKNNPDNKIDAIVIVWRNMYYGNLACGACGYGVQYLFNNTLKGFTAQIGGNYNEFDGKGRMFIVEYFHALYGGNNFHTGGGAGQYSSLAVPSTPSTTAQGGKTTAAVGWDRWFAGWHGWKDAVNGTHKQYLISAPTTTKQESPTDFDITNPFADGHEFILRDFVTYGDVIRIKLPHINWAANGDVKNQYLWIENRQLKSEFDRAAFDDHACKLSKWEKGLLAYLQVGKDIKGIKGETQNEIYGAGRWLCYAK